jgi:adenylate kinase
MLTMSQNTKYQSIVIMGKIASGKGTQAHAVVDRFGGVIYSNGNRVRESASSDSVFGRKMKETYESGKLIPEWIASYWMTHALVAQCPNEQVIFEGVAKKPEEAEVFDEIHQWLGRSYIVFNLMVSDEEVRRRSAERSRDIVDSHKSVEERLDQYREHTEKSIAIFRAKGQVIDIDGEVDPKEVTANIFKHLI